MRRLTFPALSGFCFTFGLFSLTLGAQLCIALGLGLRLCLGFGLSSGDVLGTPAAGEVQPCQAGVLAQMQEQALAKTAEERNL